MSASHVNDIEIKLAQFRNQKVNSSTNQKIGLFNWIRRRVNNKNDNQMKTEMESIIKNKKQPDEVSLLSSNNSDIDSNSDEDCQVDLVLEEDEENLINEPVKTKIDYIIIAVKVLIYILGQILAVIIGFGAVFFSISALIFICTNLRNRKRRRNELSAYSVFNPGCKPIQGTISAQQLEDQLKFGMLNHF